jgi:hypothetical protein
LRVCHVVFGADSFADAAPIAACVMLPSPRLEPSCC